MSLSEALTKSGKIKQDLIDMASIVIPLSNVQALQANLNLLESEITATDNRQHFAEFYAVMPGDNASSIVAGDSIDFPSDGAFYGSSIIRSGVSLYEFILAEVGVYKVSFQASIAEAGQLGILLNGVLVPKSIVGKDSLDGQLVCSCLISVSVVNSTLSIVNPLGSLSSLTLTASAGGASAVSANLLIERLY